MKCLRRLCFTVFAGLLSASCSAEIAPEALARYQALSVEEKRQLDVQFFNEFLFRRQASKKRSREDRVRIIQEIADKGFLPAAIALDLIEFSGDGKRTKFNPKLYQALKSLADSGDASAQCLFARAMNPHNYRPKHDTGVTQEEYERYVKLAADQDHPFCTGTWAYVKVDNLRKNGPDPDILLKAGRLGDQGAQHTIATEFSGNVDGSRGRTFPVNFGKARCWREVAYQYDTGFTEHDTHHVKLNIRAAKRRGEFREEDIKHYTTESWCEQEQVEGS